MRQGKKVVNGEIDPEGYVIEQRRTWAWKRVERLARKAESETVQLAALREFLNRTDPLPQGRPADESSRPVNVAIFLTGANGSHPGNPLPAHGVRLHLSGHHESEP